ncbi:hypothetical protein AM493_03495 [Flavobacterium akiainvivens]|uniref:Secretion system C-terminal sorting domain-containing protein n=2 Tax=Flavobacterium akiainvivens TaxID=1202724 RepID=A0A0M8M7T1_9FLAO|nr:hypothetical protein AM493_03495 [Flavobacterium akiainvivens]SFQ50663.1 Por secretion system C-terminal sorting domain-containing protein [Flavobacterium akiainvivens]
MFSAQAQYATGFEESENFAAGETVDAQGDGAWYSMTEGNETTVSSAYAATGSNSVKISGNGAAEDSDADPTGFYGGLFTHEFDVYTISQDLYLNESDSESGASLYFNSLNYDQSAYPYAGYAVLFSGDDAIYAYDYDSEEYVGLSYFPVGEWFNLSYTCDVTNNIITYYLNGEEIGQTAFADGSGIYADLLQYYTYGGTTDFYIDNVSLYSGTLSTKSVQALTFSIYPNPAVDVITISNADSALVNGIQVADVNGRIVKSAKYDGIATAQLSLADLNSGVYMVTVTSEKGAVTKKIVKN